MKDYLTECRFPTLKMGNVLVPRLILGHLPFVGESYQGRERNLEYRTRFSDVRNTLRVLRVAVEKGVTVMAAGLMGSKLAALLFEAIRETERVTDTEIAIIPCVQIPLTILGRPVDVYRRWLTYYEIEKSRTNKELLRRYLEDPILQCRDGWKTKFEEARHSSKPYGTEEIGELQLDYQRLDEAMSALRDFKVLFVEPGSETDFLAMTGRIDILETMADHILDRYDYRVIFGVHHAGSTIPILEGSKVKFEGYMTPINKLGVMMFPTVNMALDSIRASKRPVVAIKPLAGGRISPESALRHIYKELRVGFCMVGVGSESEANGNLSIALQILEEDSQISCGTS